MDIYEYDDIEPHDLMVTHFHARFTAETSADEETLKEWDERVEARCPVSDNIKHDTGVALSVERS